MTGRSEGGLARGARPGKQNAPGLFLPPMALRGRGRNYTRLRALVEAVLARAYRHDWPARLLPAGPVRPRHFALAAPLPSGTSLRIGFASDLHAGPTTSDQRLEQAFELLRAFRPDLLLLGGDYVLFEARHADRLMDLVRSVRPPLGRYAVLGNHDLWADQRLITRSLEAAGATVLVNRCVRPAPFVSIGGLDDHWSGSPDVDAAFEDAAPAHLLLMHSPDHAAHLARRRFALALCGHTHGGQVALPDGRPIVMPTPAGHRYPAGRYELAGGPMIVSRGVGNIELPFRLFAPPDVLCVTLQAA